MPRQSKSAENTTDRGIHRIVVEKNMIGEHSLELEKQFQSEITRITSPVTLDLTRTSLIDSRGIALCVGLLKECEKKGMPLTVEVNSGLARFFKLLKLNRVFKLEDQGEI